VPGTNPFFPMLHDLQGNRFLELLEEHPLEVYLMNTGRVGGPEADERSKKVRIRHSSAIVKGIAEGTIEWERDPDFGYLVASAVPGIDDVEVLQPRKLYERTGRADEYRAQGGTAEVERPSSSEFASPPPKSSPQSARRCPRVTVLARGL
jgi:phosphoenolpyruvate carboxykinase (ATP)